MLLTRFVFHVEFIHRINKQRIKDVYFLHDLAADLFPHAAGGSRFPFFLRMVK